MLASYVLIVMALHGYNDKTLPYFQEFTSRQTCEAAKLVVWKAYHDNHDDRDLEITCMPK